MHCPFIALASVRGGTGRTMGAVACAAHLHSRGIRPLVIDLDLAAPGLTHELIGVYRPTEGFLDLMVDYARGDRRNIVSDVINHAYHMGDLGISILSAAKIDAAGSALWGTNDWLYSDAGTAWMLRFKMEVAASGLFDCVLLDLRAGFAKITEAALANLSDCAVLLSHPQKSHLEHSDRFIRHMKHLRDRAGASCLKVQQVLSQVPQGCDLSGLPLLPCIPYHPVLSYAGALARDRETRGLIRANYRGLADMAAAFCGTDAGDDASLVLE